ncbi:MAG: PUA domain-containing protein [Acidilobaceae archaeon]
MSETLALRVYSVLAYQFGVEVAECFMKYERDMDVMLSPRGRIRDVLLKGERLLTLRPTIGLFALTLKAGEIIRECVEPPRHRVIIDSSRIDFIKGSVLRPIVLDIDPMVRAGAEVIVVDERDTLVGVGRLRLPPAAVKSVERGEVVRLRESKVEKSWR